MLFIYYKIDNNTNDDSKLQHDVTNISKVLRIEISKNQKTISLVKNNFNWEITSPIKWKVDNYSISDFKTIFSHLKFSEISTIEEINERGEIIQDYGVNAQSPSITIHKPANKTVIKLGKPTRDKKFIFCTIDYDNNKTSKIWRVSEEIKELVDIPLKNWADTNLVRCGLYEIDDITVSFKSNNNSTMRTSLIKQNNGWYFREPFKTKANNDQVRFLINNILSEQISEFVRNDGNETFDKTKDRWILNFSINSSGQKHEFMVSEKYNTGPTSYRFCKTGYSSHILKISESFLDNFSNWSTKLRERNIFDLKTQNLSKLKIINKYNNFEIIKVSDINWIIKTKDNEVFDGDYENIKSLLQDLNSIEIKEFLSFNPTQEELKSINKFEENYIIEAHGKDTSIKTILINKNKLNASLWKIFSVDDSLLCLVDEDLNKVLELRVYELMERRIFNQKEIYDIRIVDLDTNETIKNTRTTNDESLIEEFTNLKVQSYMNNQGKFDGTWEDGDWVPWRYEFTLNRESNSSDKLIIKTSDILGGNKLIGKFPDSNLTFNLPSNVINELFLLKKNIIDKDN